MPNIKRKIIPSLTLISLAIILSPTAYAKEDNGNAWGKFWNWGQAKKVEIKQTAETSSAPTATSTKTKKVPLDLLSCVKQATDKRDKTIIAANNTYNTNINQALATRSIDIGKAWDITDNNRNQAIKNSWQKFRQTKRSLVSTLKQTTTGAWRVFYAERKTCGSEAAQADPTTEQIDQ